ncbi:MAG TPA: hypothetical protein VIV11_16575 [Kofleriaceae bacterium]
MKKALSYMMIVVTAASLSACLIRTGPRHNHRSSASSRSCPPAYHWDGGACVHNGRGHARGHRK